MTAERIGEGCGVGMGESWGRTARASAALAENTRWGRLCESGLGPPLSSLR